MSSDLEILRRAYDRENEESMLKCIGCYELRRETGQVSPDAFKGYRKLEGNILVTYKCPRFPYEAALSGLLRPGSGITKAAECCPEDPLSRCVLCQQMTDLLHYGNGIVSICKEHGQAWSHWLDEHPERTKGLPIRANWIAVFREFIEDMRPVGLAEESRGYFGEHI